MEKLSDKQLKAFTEPEHKFSQKFLRQIQDLPLVFENANYTIRADRTGYWIWHNDNEHRGKYVHVETLESMMRYTGLEWDDPSDLIRITAARFDND